MVNPFDYCPLPALEAECALLGAMMMPEGAQVCAHARAVLDGPQAFFDPRHAAVYETILSLHADGRPTDSVSVAEELRRRNLWAQVNGREGGDYMVQIMESIPGIHSAPHHAQLVKDAALRRDEALRLTQEMEAVNSGTWLPDEDDAPPPARAWEPFPVEVLPDALRAFVEEVSASVDCDPAFVMAGLLPALSAAIGNSRVLQVKPGWDAPAIVWAAIVAESGTKKSPALDPCWEPTQKRQAEELKFYNEEMKKHNEAKKTYDRDFQRWKTKENGPPPKEPEPPHALRLWTADATIEAIAGLLDKNPRGVLLARDEMAGWLGGFDKYRAGGKGGEAAQWLECFEGRALMVDRKNSPTLCIPRAAVSVSGGIQPGILRRCLTSEHRESGLAARLLFASPPRRPRVWNEAGISEETKQKLRDVFADLFGLQMHPDENGTLAPVRVELSWEAKDAFIAFYNAHGAKIDGAVDSGAGDLAAAFSKLEGYAPRLALVLHLAKWAGDSGSAHPARVDLKSMEAGIRLAQWYTGEAERLYAMLGTNEAGELQEKLLDFIRRKGGAVSANEVRKNGPSPFQKKEADADKALARLAKRNLGHFEECRPNGRPVRLFILKSPPVAG